MNHISKVIYRLSLKFNTPLTIKRLLSHVTDIEGGSQLDQYEEIIVKRSILLPQDIGQNFIYDLSYIAANKNFIYGAEFKRTSRIVAIAPNQLPATFTDFESSDIIVIGELEYFIKDWTIYGENDGYALIIDRSKGYK